MKKLRKEMSERERMEDELEGPKLSPWVFLREDRAISTICLPRFLKYIACHASRPSTPTFSRLIAAEKASLRGTGPDEQLLTFSKGGVPVKRRLKLRN
jgi:hypothetical protein